MLKTQITGAKYLSPQTNQMTNLNIAVPADSKDTEFGTSDILLAKDVVKLSENSPQIQAIKKNIDNVNNTLNDVNSNIQELKNKVSKISTELFKIVTELPEAADADKNKIYCILTINQVDNENKYVEYIAIEEDNIWKWEKIGEFKAEPDLSGYAKLNGANFSGYVRLQGGFDGAKLGTYGGKYLTSAIQEDQSPTKVYATDGSIADLSTKANASDVLLKKSASGGYYIEKNSNELGKWAFAANDTCSASGWFSHAEGSNTIASNDRTHAEGGFTTANGASSHAEGAFTTASAYASHAEGCHNVVNNNAIHSIGIGNGQINKNSEYVYVKNNRSNTQLVDDPKNGYKYLIGVGGYDGISTDNTTYKSVQEVIADLTARIEQLETKVKALEAANTPA